jgi:predicted nucleotidyltransferase
MNNEHLVNENKILELITGSHLYGTNTPESDQDFVGVFIADKKYYIGLNAVKEVDLSTVSKTADGKNDADAIDKKFFELRNFIRLAADGNPNVIELLYPSHSSILFRNEFGKELIANAHLFPSLLVRQKFIGYAISQMKKSAVKPDNFFDLKAFSEIYSSVLDKKRLIEMQYIDSRITPLIKFHKDHASIGGLNFNLNVKMSSVYNSITTRLSKASHRQELWLRHGVDTKFLMHTLRLVFEGKELLETGRITFPLAQRELLLKVRNGEVELKEVHEMIEHYKNELEDFRGIVPATPDFDKIESLLISMVERSWNK